MLFILDITIETGGFRTGCPHSFKFKQLLVFLKWARQGATMLASSAPPLANMEMDSGPVDPVSELKLTSMGLPARDDSSLSLTATRFLLVLIEQTNALFIDYQNQ